MHIDRISELYYIIDESTGLPIPNMDSIRSIEDDELKRQILDELSLGQDDCLNVDK